MQIGKIIIKDLLIEFLKKFSMKKNIFLFLLFTLSSFALVRDIYKEVITINKNSDTSVQYWAPNDIYIEDFEGVNTWAFSNGFNINKWFVGTAVNNGGTKSLYISDNNGLANQYDITAASTTHAYKDVALPVNTSDVTFSFDWRSMGNGQSDILNVWIVPVSFTPLAGLQIFPGADRIQVGGPFSGQTVWNNYSTIVNLSAYAGQNIRLVFQWVNIGWEGMQTPAAIDNVVLKSVTCSSPFDINAQSITTTGAQISWTAPTTANIASYDYYVSQTNTIDTTTPPTGNVTTASVSIGNLTAGTQYFFWVRSNCGSVDGQSLWTGPFSFFTNCLILDLPFTETFNSDSTTVNCWSVVNNNNDNIKWNTNVTTGPFEGDRSANIPIDMLPMALNDDYLISPVFTFNGSYRLKYYYKTGWGMGPQTFSVKMSQNGGIGVSDFTQTVVAEQAYSNTQYIEKIVYLPAFTGQGALAWYVGSTSRRQIYIDKVVIEPVPACPEPYEVLSTQITDETLSIAWQQYGTVNSWEVIILPHGQSIPVDLSTITVYQTNAPSITISDLEDVTAYDVYVRAVCNPSQQSGWSSALEITTRPHNDECNKAIPLPVNQGTECVETVNGTVKAASPSNIGEVCEGNPYNDVWYEFTATSENHMIKLQTETPATTYIAVYEQGICDGQALTPIICAPTSVLSMIDLTVGNTYKIRVYTSSFETAVNFSICILTFFPIKTSDTQYTVPELVTDIFIDNECTTVSNITWSTGTNFNDVNGIGYFNKSNTSFSFKEGIILSTGKMLWARGPAGQATSTGDGYWPGDAQLTTLVNDYLNETDINTYNASVLEFDFVAITDQLKFNFIFASNEYGSFQCSFKDSFAFFLTNTATGVTTNLAVVPGTTDLISISTIRKAIHSGYDSITGEPLCGDNNPDYFQACYDPAFNGQNPMSSPINFYGLTVPMTAQSVLEPGITYHIKMVIQDRLDPYLDSAIFLEGGSFDLGSVNLGEDLLVNTGTAICSGDSYILNSGLNPAEYIIKWYRNNTLISGADGATLEVTQSGEYKIEATPINSSCPLTDTIKIEFYSEIEIVNPKNIEICVFNELIPIVDLTINENEMLSLIPDLSDIEVTYYETETAAELEEEVITDPENYLASALPKEIFVRIDDNKTGCHRIVSFKLVKKEVVELKKPEKIVVCVYDGVPVSLDLTSVRPGIVSQLTNPNVILYYYKTYENAINGIGAIASPQNYQPDTLPTTIYIRFTDTATGCELMTSVEIVASAEILPVKVEDIISCTKYILPKAPQGYFYSTEEFGKGELIKSGTVYGPGYYVVYLNVQNVNNCVFSSSYTIEVIDCSIPKGISPNGDGLNDTFDLTNYHPLEVLIYNREGMEVYAYGPGYSNQWYGQNKQGKPLPDGTYFYKIVTDNELFTGYVQLVREIK